MSLPNGLGLSLSRRGRPRRRARRRAERAHRVGGPRLARRHAVAQARARRASRRSPRLTHAAHPLRPLAVPDRARDRSDRRLVDAARPARGVRSGSGASRTSSAGSACRARSSRSGSTRLVDEGLLEKVPYAERPPRYEYRLTDKGRAFWDVLAAMWRWGEDWLWEPGRDAAGAARRSRDRAGGAAGRRRRAHRRAARRAQRSRDRAERAASRRRAKADVGDAIERALGGSRCARADRRRATPRARRAGRARTSAPRAASG